MQVVRNQVSQKIIAGILQLEFGDSRFLHYGLFSSAVSLRESAAPAQNENAELYLSMNIDDVGGGKSHRLNKIMCPYLEKRGVLTLEKSLNLYNVPQNLWRINIDRYFKERTHSFSS